MAKSWTLYWVSSGTEEDCFVVARNQRSAARIEIDMNGFDPEWVEAERICAVPKAVEEQYFSETPSEHRWPWYVYGRQFFEGIGAEFREIEGQLQMLLDEFVYEVDEFVPCSMRRAYAVGRRAIANSTALPSFRRSTLSTQNRTISARSGCCA